MKGASRARSLMRKLLPPPLPEMAGAAGRTIIMYHGIAKSNFTKFNYRFIGTADFEKQLLFFKKHFNLVSVPDYFAGAGAKDKITAAITFDDGYANNHRYALPLLKKHAIPATIYVSTAIAAGLDILLPDLIDIFSALNSDVVNACGMIFKKNAQGYYFETKTGSLLREMEREWNIEQKKELRSVLFKKADFRNKKELQDYWQLLNSSEIKEISDSGLVSIGAHGISHHAMTFVAEKDIEKEIAYPKAYLEEIIGKSISGIAYPYGMYDRKHVDLAAKAGYTEQLAVDLQSPEDKNDKRLACRIGLYPNMHCNEQIASVVEHAKKNQG